VTDEIVGGQIGEVADRSEGTVDFLALECHVRGRLPGEDVLPHGVAGVESE
jgi:hypothetical protein